MPKTPPVSRLPGLVCARLLGLLLLWFAGAAGGADPLAPAPPRKAPDTLRYYGHPAKLDSQGVIAPWYSGQNGQCDFRVRIAAETLKRYPWTTTNTAATAYPEYVFSGYWQISSNGVIQPKNPGDWGNGDIGQRSTSILMGLVDYYRYTGDPAAIAHLTYQGDFLLDYCQTPAEHPWPNFLISVPVKGKPYGRCDPRGMIQLDISANMGQALLRAYQVTGQRRWFEAAKHWGDLLAAHCNRDSGADPWPRYANPETVPWKEYRQTGGVAMVLAFLEELARLGYHGRDNQILRAYGVARYHLQQRLLNAWIADDTWGRYFWDWANPTQNCSTTADAAGYLVAHPAYFFNWRCDARNILTLFLNRSSAAPESRGDVFSGAWAYPESSSCCGRSLWYAPLLVGATLAQYAVAANDPWARELAYRQMVLQTYDIHENGVTEDNIDGGIIVNGDWFNIAHPLPLRWVLSAMGWLPEELGASRENHLVRSTAVINQVRYGAGQIEYSTFDAPEETVEVLRLSFVPKRVLADGHRLKHRRDLQSNGYVFKRLPNGDVILQVRHDGALTVQISGPDPQRIQDDTAMVCDSAGSRIMDDTAQGGSLWVGTNAGATCSTTFEGNQVRLIGRADPAGGLADVYLDGDRQMVPIDCWNPTPRSQQVLYYRNGLAPGAHQLSIVARGAKNPYSQSTCIYIDAVQSSAETGVSGYPSGTGPRTAQRLLLGYPERRDYRDSQGHSWRPGTEVVSRLALGKDTVAACWWTNAVSDSISGTSDPELYRYGFHAKEFRVVLTVGPGEYTVKLKFAATRPTESAGKGFDVAINGRTVEHEFNVATAAGAKNRAVDRQFSGIKPLGGIIAIRFSSRDGEAFVQAVELEPGTSPAR